MDVIKEEFQSGIYTIMFNRPEKRNALTFELLVAFRQALKNAQEKKASVVVIRGSGKTFSAGGDIEQVKQTPAHVDSMADALHRSIMIIRKMDAMVIAVVEGLAAGAGVGRRHGLRSVGGGKRRHNERGIPEARFDARRRQ